MTLPRLTEITHATAHTLAGEHGLRPFHGDQLFTWVMQRGILNPEAMTDLPARFRTALASTFDTRTTRILRTEGDPESSTEKVLLDVSRDGTPESVEAVLIMEGDRSTICLSTQVGCPVACGFCASGLFGLKRNLTRGEIIEQYLMLATRARAMGRAITNVVVMGMGEPMLNLGNVLGALETINDPTGPGLGARHITVSTIGLSKGVAAFTAEPRQYTLAFSLHAPTDELRRQIVPFPAAMTVDEIVEAAHRYMDQKGREVTFEYVLLDGVNCSMDHARALGRLLAGVRGTVNCIPFNEVPEQPFRRPPDRAIDAFIDELHRHRIKTTVRKRKGHDIAAACGQLRLRDLTPPA